MKRKPTILIKILHLLYLLEVCFSTTQCVPAQEDIQGEILISGAWALYPIVVRWADEFRRLYPGVKIDLSAGGAGKGMTDALNQIVDLGMISRDIYPEEIKKGAFWISVTKDAVVPVINQNHPEIDKLQTRGISKTALTEIFILGKKTKWKNLESLSLNQPIHVYTRSDACGAAQTFALFLGGNQEDLLGVGVFGDPGLAEAVKKDPLGIGFNNINFVFDHKTKHPVQGLAIYPIDLNENGHIDPEEQFYGTLDELNNAIGKGLYPSPPARDLHLVSFGKPVKKEVLRFILWILTDGQKYVHETGYIPLSREKLLLEQEKIKK